MNAYICMCVYMDLYIHIYTCRYAIRPVYVDVFQLLFFNMKLAIRLKHRDLQKIEVVIVANLKQVLLKITMIHFSINYSTALL